MDVQVNGKSCKTAKKFWCVCTDLFTCPRCNEKVFAKAFWKPGANFRSSVCAHCGALLCLKFNDDSCERCKRRQPNCLLKVHLRVHVFSSHSKLKGAYAQIALGLVGMKYLQYLHKP
jgi:hypothetical protein